jgi:hypothetical protein
MAAVVKYPGIPKVLGGIEYVIPPIALRPLQQLQSRINAFGNSIDEESIETAVTVIHSALKRNYPEITIEEVGDMVDVGNMFELFEAVMDVSGMKRKALETGGDSGEPLPGQD